VRKALQMSLNVPAVILLDAIHANRLTARIADAGVKLQLPKARCRVWQWGSAASASRFPI